MNLANNFKIRKEMMDQDRFDSLHQSMRHEIVVSKSCSQSYRTSPTYVNIAEPLYLSQISRVPIFEQNLSSSQKYYREIDGELRRSASPKAQDAPKRNPYVIPPSPAHRPLDTRPPSFKTKTEEKALALKRIQMEDLRCQQRKYNREISYQEQVSPRQVLLSNCCPMSQSERAALRQAAEFQCEQDVSYLNLSQTQHDLQNQSAFAIGGPRDSDMQNSAYFQDSMTQGTELLPHQLATQDITNQIYSLQLHNQRIAQDTILITIQQKAMQSRLSQDQRIAKQNDVLAERAKHLLEKYKQLQNQLAQSKLDKCTAFQQLQEAQKRIDIVQVQLEQKDLAIKRIEAELVKNGLVPQTKVDPDQ